jgi:hypothetical protein
MQVPKRSNKFRQTFAKKKLGIPKDSSNLENRSGVKRNCNKQQRHPSSRTMAYHRSIKQGLLLLRQLTRRIYKLEEISAKQSRGSARTHLTDPHFEKHQPKRSRTGKFPQPDFTHTYTHPPTFNSKVVKRVSPKTRHPPPHTHLTWITRCAN